MKIKLHLTVCLSVFYLSLTAQNLIVEKHGIAIAEAENVIDQNGWNTAKSIIGYSGNAYMVCTTDNLKEPNDDQISTIKVLISSPGTYNINLRNIHLHPRRDMWNDCWLKVDGSVWYKMYSSWDQPVGEWGWDSKVHTKDDHVTRWENLKAYFEPGIHEIQIGARSKDFIIDRIAVYLDENREKALDLSTPVSSVMTLNEYNNQDVIVSGSLKKWHPLTINFKGVPAKESDVAPNPFLDYRLQVKFTGPGGQVYNVPGYFDGDGKGNGEGNIWKVKFSPDQVGKWKYTASFRKGNNIAISLNPKEGEKVSFDGTSGSFQVSPCDEFDPEFYLNGRLEHVGEFYFKFRDGNYWIKGGVDSPEDFLAYAGFDNTPQSHFYDVHKEDWQLGNPDWDNGKGKAIIGALNYLSSKKVNSLYFLTMNVGGDGKNVWPWIGRPPVDPNHPLVFDSTQQNSDKYDNLHFDISKLNQWSTVLEHAQRKGIMLHFVLNEAETPNKLELDSAKLGVERKLFYREQIARFGHYPALLWNLCEEYNLNQPYEHDELIAFAEYIKSVDPYKHPVTVHHEGDPFAAIQFVFENKIFDCTSIQPNMTEVSSVTEGLRDLAIKADNKIPIMLDEFSVVAGDIPFYFAINHAELHRIEKIWPIYFSGGQIEFILEELLNTENFKTPQLDLMWDYTWYARKFMDKIPFHEMEPADELVFDEEPYMVATRPRNTEKIITDFEQLHAQVFAKRGEVYAIYYPKARYTGFFNASELKEDMVMVWFNPRTGYVEGDEKIVTAGSEKFEIGLPPTDVHADWVVLMKKTYMEKNK